MDEKPKILIVDDDDVMRLACELTLQQEDMEVDKAENGKLALEKIKSNYYDLILLDLMMPEMTGTELLEAIKEFDENIIVIVITGFATIESAVDTLKKGVYDYIPKPFTPEELRKVVRKGLDRRKLLNQASTLRKEREKSLLKLAAQKSKMSTIINCMGEGLIATDKNAQISLINPIACKMLNIQEPCHIGTSISGLLNNEELEVLILEMLKKENHTSKFQKEEIIFNEKENKTYSVTLAPIKENKNEISGLVLVLVDISEKKKLEKMKAEFQKLVAVVTHELKAPINTIEGYLDIIIKGYLDNDIEKQKKYLIRSRDKAETLRNLVQDLLSITSIESGKLTKEKKSVDVALILKDILTFMENDAKAKKLNIIFNLPENLPNVMGDKNSLTYLFSNFLSNAIKYNKINGTVEINGKIDNKHMIISIRDTGFGISEEDQGKLFEEFYRSKNEKIQNISGTGLGLNISKRIAKVHKGFIKVDSKINEGSQFDIYLPINLSS